MTPLTLTLLLAPATFAAPRDLPPAADAWRFPPWQVCQRQITFNDGFRDKVTEERRLWPESMQAPFAAAVDEAVALRKVWAAAYYADWYDLPSSERTRREYLADLRDLLGDDDYRAGRMPAVVPLHRFRELRP